jgi:hypothetical protein
MSKAIHSVVNIPAGSLPKDERLRVFLIAVLATVAYGPEHERDERFDELKREYEGIIGDMAELESALETRFFTHLYVERVERIEIESVLPLKKFLLVHGLVGSGKSTILRKIDLNLEERGDFEFIYFDLAAAAQEISPLPGTDFIDRLKNYLYDKIYSDYVQESELSVLWDIHTIRYDPNYSHIKRKVNSIMGRVIASDEDWQESYENSQIREMYNATKERPELVTLLGFLKRHYSVALCFDNIDRFPVDPQQQIVTFCTDLNKNLDTTIILAIREPNLGRLRSEAVELRKSCDDLAELLFVNYLERLEAGQERDFAVGSMPWASVKALLNQRLQFIQSHRDLSVFSEFLDEFLRSRAEERASFPRSATEYEIRFWAIFDVVSDTFVDEDVYRLCNHSIREMLKTYFLFINALMLSAEKEYNLRRVFLDQSQIGITKLRNYFYRFILCNGKPLPDPSCNFPAILSDAESGLAMLDNNILQYCYNHEKRYPAKRLRFRQIRSDFERFGVDSELLEKRIVHLVRPHGIHEMGLLFLDGNEGFIIKDETPIELQPSGEYYLERLSTSREYLFWNALCADLEPPLFRGQIDYSKTYSDAFKYRVIHRFIADYLVKLMEKELEHFNSNLFPPRQWPGSKIDYYRSHFAPGGRLYITNAIESVIGTITHSSLSTKEQKQFRRMYHSLNEKFNRMVCKYISLYGKTS